MRTPRALLVVFAAVAGGIWIGLVSPSFEKVSSGFTVRLLTAAFVGSSG
jgi:hypothetical protein